MREISFVNFDSYLDRSVLMHVLQIRTPDKKYGLHFSSAGQRVAWQFERFWLSPSVNIEDFIENFCKR